MEVAWTCNNRLEKAEILNLWKILLVFFLFDFDWFFGIFNYHDSNDFTFKKLNSVDNNCIKVLAKLNKINISKCPFLFIEIGMFHYIECSIPSPNIHLSSMDADLTSLFNEPHMG